MLHFLIDTLCIFFAFAAGYYRNMTLFTLTALAFWVYCLWHGRARRTRMPDAGQGSGPDAPAAGGDAPGTGKK